VLRKHGRTHSSAAAMIADPVEVARFDALAEEWWKPDGAFKVSHAFNRVRVAHFSERLPALREGNLRQAQPLGGARITDVGCGAGLVAEPLSRAGAEVGPILPGAT
jgi:2-polyprenyl-6-hydroxyphenyl methylase / 3-demethylubiquinone-9 3-methyltransferase